MTITTTTTDPHAPSRRELVEYEGRLRHDNEHASDEEIAGALAEWAAEQTKQRRAQAERSERQREKDRRAALCLCCGERPGAMRFVLGPENEREQRWSGFAVSTKVCAICLHGLEFALGHEAYGVDPERFDSFAAELVARHKKDRGLQ